MEGRPNLSSSLVGVTSRQVSRDGAFNTLAVDPGPIVVAGDATGDVITGTGASAGAGQGLRAQVRKNARRINKLQPSGSSGDVQLAKGDGSFTSAGDLRFTGSTLQTSNLQVGGVGYRSASGTKVFMNDLPTEDPGVKGQLWVSGDALRVSRGRRLHVFALDLPAGDTSSALIGPVEGPLTGSPFPVPGNITATLSACCLRNHKEYGTSERLVVAVVGVGSFVQLDGGRWDLIAPSLDFACVASCVSWDSSGQEKVITRTQNDDSDTLVWYLDKEERNILDQAGFEFLPSPVITCESKQLVGILEKDEEGTILNTAVYDLTAEAEAAVIVEDFWPFTCYESELILVKARVPPRLPRRPGMDFEVEPQFFYVNGGGEPEERGEVLAGVCLYIPPWSALSVVQSNGVLYSSFRGEDGSFSIGTSDDGAKSWKMKPRPTTEKLLWPVTASRGIVVFGASDVDPSVGLMGSGSWTPRWPAGTGELGSGANPTSRLIQTSDEGLTWTSIQGVPQDTVPIVGTVCF